MGLEATSGMLFSPTLLIDGYIILLDDLSYVPGVTQTIARMQLHECLYLRISLTVMFKELDT